jgi:hypothetical protein
MAVDDVTKTEVVSEDQAACIKDMLEQSEAYDIGYGARYVFEQMQSAGEYN